MNWKELLGLGIGGLILASVVKEKEQSQTQPKEQPKPKKVKVIIPKVEKTSQGTLKIWGGLAGAELENKNVHVWINPVKQPNIYSSETKYLKKEHVKAYVGVAIVKNAFSWPTIDVVTSTHGPGTWTLKVYDNGSYIGGYTYHQDKYNAIVRHWSGFGLKKGKHLIRADLFHNGTLFTTAYKSVVV